MTNIFYIVCAFFLACLRFSAHAGIPGGGRRDFNQGMFTLMEHQSINRTAAEGRDIGVLRVTHVSSHTECLFRCSWKEYCLASAWETDNNLCDIFILDFGGSQIVAIGDIIIPAAGWDIFIEERSDSDQPTGK